MYKCIAYLYDFWIYGYDIVMCWEFMQQIWYVGLLAKYHTKRCLESQNNAAGHMAFVGVANMSARLVLVARHMLICLFFLQLIPI